MERSGKRKILLAGGSVVLVGVLAISLMGMMPGGGGGGMGGGPGGRGGEAEDQSAAKTVVETGAPIMGSIVVSTSFVGTVEPGQQVTVYPKASGEVLSTYFNVGDTVEAGEVLFTIDSTDLQYSIAQSEASLANAKALASYNVESAQKDLETYQYNLDEGYNTTLMDAQNSVTTAEINVQSASNNVASARRALQDLRDDGDYTDTEYRNARDTLINAQLNLENAQQTLENAEERLRAVEKQVRVEQQEAAEDSVALAELNANKADQEVALEKLRNDLANYTVTSPISGVVEAKHIDVYDMTSTGSAAYVISNKEAVMVSFSVAENTLDYMKQGDTVTVEKDGQTATGVITEVSNMVDSSSGLFGVKASVENAPFELRSGANIKLYADTQKVENEMMVPIDAVYYDNGTPYVYVFQNNTSVKKGIETGISDDDYIQVLSGLSLSDEIIVTWSSSLYDGSEVYLPGTAPQDGGDLDGQGTPGMVDPIPVDEGDEGESPSPRDGSDAGNGGDTAPPENDTEGEME